MSADNGVLAGLRVIDCATYVAGPAAATILSDFGADVIKIERPPDGDLWRSFCSRICAHRFSIHVASYEPQ